MNLDESFGLAVENGPINFAEFLDERLDRNSLVRRAALGKPHVGNFGISICAPGKCQAADARLSRKQGILDDNAGHGVGGMCELEARADVARGEYARICRPQMIIDDYPRLRVELDAGA